MKLVIPMAGKGTRLRPHTLIKSKPMLKVAGKTMLQHLLDPFLKLNISEIIFVVNPGQGDKIVDLVKKNYKVNARFVEQKVADGTAGAVILAKEFITEDVIIIYADTLNDADLSLVKKSQKDKVSGGIFWAKEVENYQAFGVLVTDAKGYITKIVEKPKEPISKLANIGMYYIKDYKLLNNIMIQVASIMGPMLAGFVIAGWGVGAVYWINAGSFLAVLGALLLMKTPAQKKLGAVRVSSEALFEGIKFVFSTKIIAAVMLVDFLATFFSSASALLPIFAKDILHVGPEGLGILYGAESVGAVIAGIAMARAGTIKRQGAILLTAVGAYGAATAFYGASQLFALSFFFLALLGASDTVSTILRNTIRQMSTPDHLRGRMTSVNMIFFQGGPQLGNLEAGIVAALFGAPFSVISGGVATVIVIAAIAWFVPQLRNYTGQ